MKLSKTLSFFALVFALFALGGTVRQASAATSGVYIAISTADLPDVNPGDGICKSSNNKCTLRAAVAETNFYVGQDVIYLKARTDYVLTSPLVIASDLVIYGGGMGDDSLIGDGGDHRLMEIMSGISVGMVDIGFVNGKGADGAAILNHGSLELVHAYFGVNQSGGDGGALYNTGSAVLSDSQFSGNTAANSGGAIFNAGTLHLTSVTLADNVATAGSGGGLANQNSATTVLVNSTISGNSAGSNGGGIYSGLSSTVNSYNVTIVRNTANQQKNGGDGGGVSKQSGNFTLSHTLIADNSKRNAISFTNNDCSGAYIIQRISNIENVGSCTLDQTAAASVSGDPELGVLDNNGGYTPTHTFNNASIFAVDTGTPGSCLGPGNTSLMTDQRGFPRVVDGNGIGGANCDIGSLEFNAPDPCPSAPSAPNIVTPSASSQNQPRIVLVDWDQKECASAYKITIRLNSKKGAVVETKGDVYTTHWITKKLAKHQTYFVNVQACNTHGCGKGATFTFRTK